MYKIFKILIALLMASGYSTSSFADINEDFCKISIQKFKHGLPAKIDQSTTLFNVSCKEDFIETIQFYYQISNVENSTLIRDALNNQINMNMRAKVTGAFCQNDKSDLIAKFDLQFIYLDKNSNLISDFKITNKDCASN